MSQNPQVFEFLLLDAFSMMSVTSAIEPLRAANRLLGREVYRWQFSSEDGQPVLASNAMLINAGGRVGDTDAPTYLFICAGAQAVAADQTRMTVVLRKLARDGCKVGALSMGTLLLARSGLLDERRCTLHWEGIPAFREEFPLIDVCDELYVIDRERYTCAGGTAALDLILHLVSHVYGDGLAQAIANQFQVDRIRPGKIAQRPADLAPTETLPEHLKVAIDLMKKNLEGNMGVEEIIRRSGVSARAMQRNFKRHLATSPGQFFIRLRLEHAKNLIRHTALPLTEIAISSGFNSASYFANCYRHHYGYTPSQERAATFAGGKAPLER